MTTQPPAQGTTDPGGGAASNAGYSLLAHLVSGAFTAGLILFFARALGPQDYGLFTLSIAIGVLRSCCGAVMMSSASCSIAALRAFTAPARVTRSIRIASTIPSVCLGIVVALPESARPHLARVRVSRSIVAATTLAR
jgi:O-antigen/teichoic acid export membrane protein